MSVKYISVYKCRQKTNSMKYSEYIKQIEIDSLWSGKRHIVWNLDRKVNILSGINGVGKSTILNKVVRGWLQAESSRVTCLKAFASPLSLKTLAGYATM